MIVAVLKIYVEIIGLDAVQEIMGLAAGATRQHTIQRYEIMSNAVIHRPND